MELRALLEAVRMAEGPCTVVSDYETVVNTVRQGKVPGKCRELWEQLYATAAGKDVTFGWRRRGQFLGQRTAHQVARGMARGV